MKTVFDISTSQVVEIDSAENGFGLQHTTVNGLIAPSAGELQPRLQEVIAEQHEEKCLPPDLALVDLDAFLDEMR